MVVTRNGGHDKFAVGKIVEKENPEQLSNAILDILSLTHDKHSTLCRAAHRKAQEFSWESIVEQRLELYDRVRGMTPIRSHQS